MERRLRYSERKRLVETGSLDPLETGKVPSALRTALDIYIFERNYFSREGWRIATAEHFGSGMGPRDLLRVSSLEPVADMLELYVEEAGNYAGYSERVQRELNSLFDRHRWGFRFDGGQLVELASPALHEAIVGPALLATQREGWEEVERSYREALHHQRGGDDEIDDAITAAHAALEAALKAAGMKGNELGQLAKSFRNSDLAPQVANVPELLDALLKRSAAVRNTMGDAHGKEPGAAPVPRELANLAIHWTGAFIVYMADASDA